MQVLGLFVIIFMAYYSHKGNQSQSIIFKPTVDKNTLGICGLKPNCVSSFHKDSQEHFIAPKKIDTNPIAKVKEHFQFCTLIKESSNYLQFECQSNMFKFVDDIEILYISEDGLLHYRSASRIGKSDLGANRKRINNLINSF